MEKKIPLKIVLNLYFSIAFAIYGSAQTITVVPDACNGSSNIYSLSGKITNDGTLPTTGHLLVSVEGEGSAYYNAPFTSPLNYKIVSLNADGKPKTVTFTYLPSNLSFTQTFTAPQACINNGCPNDNFNGSITYQKSFPLQEITLNNEPIQFPRFDTNSGTRTLIGVLITVKSAIKTNSLFENSGNSISNLSFKPQIYCYIDKTDLADNKNLITQLIEFNTSGLKIGEAVNIPDPIGNYIGDVENNGKYSTMNGLIKYHPNWTDALNEFQNPKTEEYNWITFLTGNPNSDADFLYIPTTQFYNTSSFIENNPTKLNSYCGFGELPLTISTLFGMGISGGPNVTISGFSRFKSELTLTYYFCSTTEVLPLKLINFKATKLNNCNRLNWETKNEQKLSSFTIERSTDNSSYEVIDKVAANNTTFKNQYLYDDCYYNPSNEYYYRLKMVDMDGSFYYSPTVLVKGNNSAENFLVYPNPATIDIHVKSTEEIDRIEISNEMGTIVESKSIYVSGQAINISQLQAGVYFLKINTQNGTRFAKFVKK